MLQGIDRKLEVENKEKSDPNEIKYEINRLSKSYPQEFAKVTASSS